MNMRELTRHIARAVHHKVLLSLTILLALAAVADHFYLLDQPVAAGTGQVLSNGLPTSSDDAGKRAGTSDPRDDGSAAQLMQFVMPSDNGPGRTILGNTVCSRSMFWTGPDPQIGAVSTTPSMVDSRLGRQLTLIGARPTGTS